MANPSLTEYVAQSQRGLYQSIFGPGFLMKDTFSGTAFGSTTAGDTLSVASVFNTTYGRKVWQALNNQTRFFNAIPRVVWGNTAGWRIRTDRGNNRSQPVEEAGVLPTVDVSNLESVHSLPRIVSTTFGASVKSVFVAQLEGGVGDVLALENENAQLDHVKEINEELLAASMFSPGSAGGTNNFILADADAKHFKIGDLVYMNDGPGTERINTKITAKSSTGGNTTFTVGTLPGGVSSATAYLIYVQARAGFTSLDDIVSEDVNGPIASWPAGAGAKVYNIGVAGGTGNARTAGSWNAGANVNYNGGTARDLSLNLIDTCIQKIRENGGEPKLILCGHDQYFKLERLLNSQQRYMGQEEYQVGIGSERTFPGTRTGLVLATYMGIPIMPDADVPKSVAGGGTNMYVLDTDYLETAVAQPTQYIENRDYFAANQLVVRGLLYTMAELRCKNFFVQAKIGDLSA